MDADAAKKLRAPFKPGQIGKLPKPTRKENPKGKCSECGGWHGLPAVHLDYVGHAATTDRFLEVDPDWTWEPMARGVQGEPLIVNGGLWINLTICGVTRPGFGDATGSGGMKEMIGDALRNAGMRFGVGLDLWAKEDLHATESGAGTPVKKAEARSAEEAPNRPVEPAAVSSNGDEPASFPPNVVPESDGGDVLYATEKQRKRMFGIANKLGVPTVRVREIIGQLTGQETGRVTTAQLPATVYEAVIAAIEAESVPA